jgi:tetratricopeptide (TPR) repeat protein
MARAVKRRSVRSDSQRVRAQKPARPLARAWSLTLGEAVILALVVAVPIAINTKSQVLTDVKDAILGLGAALGLSLWLVAGLAQRRLSWVRTPLLPLSLGYLVWALIGTFYSGYPAVVISEVGRLAAGVGLFLLVLLSIRDLPQVRRLIAATCVVSVPVSIYAFAQHAGHDFVTWAGGQGTERVFSFLGNPTYLGGFAVLLVPPIAAAVSWSREGRRLPRRLLWPALAVLVLSLLTIGYIVRGAPSLLAIPGPTLKIAAFFAAVASAALLLAGARPHRIVGGLLMLASLAMLLLAMYFSFTIAAVIGLALGAALALVVALLRGGTRVIAITTAALVAAALIIAVAAPTVYRQLPPRQQARVQQVIHLQDPSAPERRLHWRTALSLFRESPVVGKGYGAFRVYSLTEMTAEWYSQGSARRTQMLMPGYAHNEYLQVLADTGLIGAVLLLALLAAIYVTLIRVALRHPQTEWRRLALGLIAAITAFLFQNLVGVTFRQAGASMFLWLWMGVAAVGAASIPRREGQPGRTPLADWRGADRSTGAVVAAALGAAVVLAVLAWVSIIPLVANMRVRLARALAADGHYREAVAVCDATLDLCPSSTLAEYVKAFAAGQLGDHQTAVKANEAALKLAPGNASAYYNLGVSYKQLHQYADAEKAFREAIRLMPIKQHYASLAETLFESGRLDEAEQETRRVLAMDPEGHEEPDNTRVQALLATIEATRSARAPLAPQSVDALRAALRVQPNSAALCGQLTVTLIRQKRYREGLTEAWRWARLAPNSAEAQRAIGVCTFSLGDFPNAKKAFQRQVELEPANMKARLDLAFTCVKLRDYDSALAGFRYVAEHGGDSPEAEEAKRVLAKVRPPAPARPGQPSR